MSRKVKGMVSLQGITYRIVRVASGTYSVVRIHDDQEVGAFKIAPLLDIEARLVEPELLREVARLAIHTAKTSYVGFAAPLAPPVSAAPAPAPAPLLAQGVNAVLQRPSSTPPPLAAT